MSEKKNAMVFTTWSYKDGLTQGAALPYVRILQQTVGGKVYMICWEQPRLALTEEEAKKAKAELLHSGIHLILLPYHKNKLRAAFGWAVEMAKLLATCYRNRIRHFHSLCTPAGCIAYIISRFRRVKLVADSLEPHADLMAETGVWSKASWVYRLSFYLEKKLVKNADALIVVSKNIYPYFVNHYQVAISREALYYRPYCVDATLFKPLPPDYSLLGWKDKKAGVIGVYTGKLGGMYFDTAFCTFIKGCIKHWNGDFHLVFCTSMPVAETTQYLESQGIATSHFTICFAPLPQLPQYLALADFGLSFSRPSEARQYGCPTKNPEYWAAGLPVAATNAILDDNQEITANPFLGVLLTEEDLVQPEAAIARLDEQVRLRSRNLTRIRDYAITQRSFDKVRKVYKEIYG